MLCLILLEITKRTMKSRELIYNNDSLDMEETYLMNVLETIPFIKKTMTSLEERGKHLRFT